MIRKSFFFILSFFCLGLQAQQKWSQINQQYIDQYKDLAIEQMLRWKIPASITLAQGLLESGAGKSTLALKANNHFGIKCHGWTGITYYQDDDEKNECFRVYGSAYESFEDHSRFLATGQRYRDLFKLKHSDYKGWAKGLKAAGYATNPQYPKRLIDIIQLYKLYDYDKAKSYDHYLVAHLKDNTLGGQPLHTIKIYNDNYYVIARAGDTFKLIGEEINVSYKKIAKYNERDRNDPIEPGEIIWLKKKKTKAPKSEKGRLYYVKAGDSMYSISQQYGMRLKALYKINKLQPDYQIRVGDALKLR